MAKLGFGFVAGIAIVSALTMGCALDGVDARQGEGEVLGTTEQALVSLPLRTDASKAALWNVTTFDTFGLDCGVLGWCGKYETMIVGTIQMPALQIDADDGGDRSGDAKIVWGPVEAPADGDYVLRTGTAMYVDLSTRVNADSTLIFHNEWAAADTWLEYRVTVDGSEAYRSTKWVLRDSTTNENRSKTVRSRYPLPTEILIRSVRAHQIIRMETTLKMLVQTVGDGTLARVTVRTFGAEANSTSLAIARLEQ